MKLKDADFFRLILYIRNKYGIDLRNKRAMVESKMDHCKGVKQFSSILTYIEELEKEVLLSNELISIMTTNYTYFLREMDHFEYLKNNILQGFLHHTELSIWSAAVSSGEEIYSIYMAIDDFCQKHSYPIDIKLEASDISLQALETAKRGIYEEEKLSKISDEWKARYFIKNNSGKYKINQSITNSIYWYQKNLLEKSDEGMRFDVIFLRNVLSYFDPYGVNVVVDNIVKSLKPGGYLFIGEKETITINSSSLRRIEHAVFQNV